MRECCLLHRQDWLDLQVHISFYSLLSCGSLIKKFHESVFLRNPNNVNQIKLGYIFEIAQFVNFSVFMLVAGYQNEGVERFPFIRISFWSLVTIIIAIIL